MGIRGLKSFIECNPHLLLNHELQDTHLIIDGNNLLYMLYFDSGINYHYGGDYDKYRDVITTVFSSFKKCNISPIIIFDGGYTVDDRKKNTTIKRAKNRNLVVSELAAGMRPRIRSLPILAQEVLYETLRQLEIPFCQCDFEADNEIAVLAKFFESPILSQDSDFYIYDNPSGFIPIDSIDFEAVACNDDHEKSFMRCKMFYVENFMSYFPNFKKSVLPVFSTLCGNDYYDGKIFDSFYDQLPNIPKFKSKKLKKNLLIGKRFFRMIALLQWLENKDTEEAIQAVKQYLRKGCRDAAEQMLKQTISMYQDNTSSCFEYIMGKLNKFPSSDKVSLPQGQDRLSLPDWFIELFRQGILSSFLVNCIIVRRVMLLTQIEDVNIDSTYTCSLSIRRHLYAILKQISDFDGTVNEYIRCKHKFQPHVVNHEPMYLSHFNAEYKTQGILSNEVKGIYFEILGVSSKFVDKIPSELAFEFATFVYWLNNASPLIKEQHLNSILLSVLYYGFIIPISNNQSALKILSSGSSGSGIEFLRVNEAIDKEKAAAACKTIKKIISKNNAFNLKIVHNYCQLQTCLLYASYLKRLMLPEQTVATKFTLFNGSFIHNICYDLEGRSNPDLYICELLGRESNISKLFFLMREYILAEVDDARIVKHGVTVSRGKSRKKQKLKSKSVMKSSDLNVVDVYI